MMLLLLLSLTSDILSADLFRSLCCYVKCQRFSFWVKLSLQITDLRSSCVLCFRAVTTPQTWMIWPTYIIFLMSPADYILIATFCRHVGARFTASANIWPRWHVASGGPGAPARRCRIHPSQRQSSAAVPRLSGHACTELMPLTDLSLLPALLPCCDNATMVDAKTHLLYPQSVL